MDEEHPQMADIKAIKSVCILLPCTLVEVLSGYMPSFTKLSDFFGTPWPSVTVPDIKSHCYMTESQ